MENNYDLNPDAKKGPFNYTLLNIPTTGKWVYRPEDIELLNSSSNSNIASGLNRDANKSAEQDLNIEDATFKGKRHKLKLKKSDRNVKILKAEEVAGHRTETDINLILQFIENENYDNTKKNETKVKVNKTKKKQ